MTIRNDDEILHALDQMQTLEADKFAQEMEDILMDIADLDLEACPPDRRFFKGDREAWVYEHGNVAELVFVKTD